MKRIHLQYFAMFREQSGKSQEEVETSAVTAADLYEELRARYGFEMPSRLVRVSLNMSFAGLDAEIANGDSIVFIPPVAGG